jgi:dihydrodipicolinate synthase/N-acetylneuraminate lyase
VITPFSPNGRVDEALLGKIVDDMVKAGVHAIAPLGSTAVPLLVQLCGEEVALYNGSNPLALAAFVAGARGWCTAAPHIIPKLNIELYDAIQRGDLTAARRSSSSLTASRVQSRQRSSCKGRRSARFARPCKLSRPSASKSCDGSSSDSM